MSSYERADSVDSNNSEKSARQLLGLPSQRTFSEEEDSRSMRSYRSSRVSSRRQSTTDDSIDSDDEWYRHELKYLEVLEHEQRMQQARVDDAYPSEPDLAVHSQMHDVLAQLVTTVAEKERQKEEKAREEAERERQRAEEKAKEAAAAAASRVGDARSDARSDSRSDSRGDSRGDSRRQLQRGGCVDQPDRRGEWSAPGGQGSQESRDNHLLSVDAEDELSTSVRSAESAFFSADSRHSSFRHSESQETPLQDDESAFGSGTSGGKEAAEPRRPSAARAAAAERGPGEEEDEEHSSGDTSGPDSPVNDTSDEEEVEAPTVTYPAPIPTIVTEQMDERPTEPQEAGSSSPGPSSGRADDKPTAKWKLLKTLKERKETMQSQESIISPDKVSAGSGRVVLIC